jgi:hypothetical protein
MKVTLKILKWILISFAGIISIFLIVFLVYSQFFYKREMNQIKENLNKIENVEVIEIWGQNDITLEEISVRLKVKNKGEIVLYGLSKDSFNYPKSIPINEIGGYSFTSFYCNGGIGSNINIGTEGEFFELTKKEFKSVDDIVQNYDLILKSVNGLKKFPEINHFETPETESYILVHRKKSLDQDPIFNLIGVDSWFEYAEKLKWTKADCYYNEK